VETVRDLARAESWRESNERSRARREKSTRSPKPVARVRGIVALALALVALASLSVLGGHGHRGSVAAARAEASGSAAAPGRAGAASGYNAAAAVGGRTSPLVGTSTGYVNPLSGASVKPERIDMGVDYAGSGTLVAIGTARLTYVATSGTGWPGAFIEYRLLGGPDAGRYVYYAEGVIPAPRLQVGQTVAAGQVIASIIPDYETGIEVGWGAGANTKTFAQTAGHWSGADDEDNVASPAGKSFSALIAALGGPAGKVEG
jgi:murein DD-endopeptidase MepM/ murein hydrolase activator NlpD